MCTNTSWGETRWRTCWNCLAMLRFSLLAETLFTLLIPSVWWDGQTSYHAAAFSTAVARQCFHHQHGRNVCTPTEVVSPGSHGGRAGAAALLHRGCVAGSTPNKKSFIELMTSDRKLKVSRESLK